MPLNNSLFLRLSPALRRQHVRLCAKNADYKALLEKAKEKALLRHNRSLVRRHLRSKALAALKKKLSQCSKKETLVTILPRAGTSKRKKKFSAETKPSLKNPKPSKKFKASAKTKTAKKQSEKNQAETLANKLVSAAKKAEKPSTVDTSSWPFPPDTQVRVVSEEAGPLFFSREGDVKGFSDGRLNLFSAYGTFSVPASLVKEKDSGWASPKSWKGFNSMSRETLQGILKVTGALHLALEEKAIDHLLIKVPTDFSVLLEEQHILWGWELLCWTWPLNCKQFSFIEPTLLYQLEVVSAASDWPHKALEQLLAGKCRLLCPIWSVSPNHWTLLEGERASPDRPWSLTYRDSLHPPSENGLKQARSVAALLGVLDPALVPVNASRQADNECGFFVLSWMELIVAGLSEGPASRLWPAELAKAWHKQRLLPLEKALQKETRGGFQGLIRA